MIFTLGCGEETPCKECWVWDALSDIEEYYDNSVPYEGVVIIPCVREEEA